MKNDPSLTDNNEKFSIAENKEYYTKTTNRIKELEAMIESLEKEGNSKTDKEKQDGINEITNLIKTERENFYNTIDFLPNYDKTLYAKMYDDTLDKVTKLKNKFFPKKKFAFSSKVAKTTNKVQEQATSSNEVKKTENIEGDINDLVLKDILSRTIKYDDTDPKIQNKNNVIIENITDSSIYLLFNFKACYIKTIKNSKIYIGSVSGGSHITNSDGCEIYIASHQLRIHDTTNTNFYVLTNSNPIIEKSTKNIFHPLKISYKNYEENITKAKFDTSNNKWNQVQDFQWLKKEKSPNFDTRDDNEEVKL